MHCEDLPVNTEENTPNKQVFNRTETTNPQLAPSMQDITLVVEGLVDSTATHPAGLRATDVDVLEQNAGGGVGDGHVLSLGDLVVDECAGGLVDRLELLLGGDAPLDHLLLQSGNGVVGAAHALDLLTAAVGGAGVGHGVAAVAVGDVLEDEGSLAGDGVVLAVLHGRLGGEDVHAVDLETGNVLATLVVLGEGGGAGSGGTHTVLVVWRMLVRDLDTELE